MLIRTYFLTINLKMKWGQLTGDRVSVLIVEIGFESSFNFVLDCEMSTVVYRDLNFVLNCFDIRSIFIVLDENDRSFIHPLWKI